MNRYSQEQTTSYVTDPRTRGDEPYVVARSEQS